MRIYSLIGLRNDEIQDFDTRWDEILLSMTKISPDDVLESLYNLRIRESDQLKSVLELYNMEIHQKISIPNYQQLKTMVKRSNDQKLRLRNFAARNKRIETGAVVTSRRGLSGIDRGKGFCNQWKAKGQCSRGDQCSFGHEGHERAKPIHPLSHQHQEVDEKKTASEQESVWEDQSTAVQKLLERYLH